MRSWSSQCGVLYPVMTLPQTEPLLRGKETGDAVAVATVVAVMMVERRIVRCMADCVGALCWCMWYPINGRFGIGVLKATRYDERARES
jgi:hypothetical protein